MTRAPLPLSEEAVRATTYTICHVSDFLLVPEDRLSECLREFRIMLDMARASIRLVEAVADEMVRSGDVDAAPGWLRMQLVNRFEWIDDGKRTATMRIHTGQESRDGSPTGETTP